MKNNLQILYDRMSNAERLQLIKLFVGFWPNLPDEAKSKIESVPGFFEAVKKELEAS